MTEVLNLKAPRNEIEAAGAGAFELSCEGAENGDFRFHPIEGQLVIDFVPTADTCGGDIIIGEGEGASELEAFFGDGTGVDFHFFKKCLRRVVAVEGGTKSSKGAPSRASSRTSWELMKERVSRGIRKTDSRSGWRRRLVSAS